MRIGELGRERAQRTKLCPSSRAQRKGVIPHLKKSQKLIMVGEQNKTRLTVNHSINEFSQSSIKLLSRYVGECTKLEEVDAPGKFMAWLIHQKEIIIYGHKISGRFDIGNLKQAKETMAHYSSVTEHCCARAALMGNPSDGFNGATLALLIKNFKATVTIQENSIDETNKDCNNQSIHLIPHPVLDNYTFVNLQVSDEKNSKKGESLDRP